MAAPSKSRSDKPSKVSLNLDAIDAEYAADRLTVTLGGKPYALTDFGGIDYRDFTEAEKVARATGDGESLMRLMVDESDFEAFSANKISLRAMSRLSKLWREYAGMDLDLGEGSASSPS